MIARDAAGCPIRVCVSVCAHQLCQEALGLALNTGIATVLRVVSRLVAAVFNVGEAAAVCVSISAVVQIDAVACGGFRALAMDLDGTTATAVCFRRECK